MKTETISVAELVAQGMKPECGENRPVVLVLDDDVVVADTIVEVLKRSGFCAMAMYRAEAALAYAALVPPDLMIIDVLLPGMNGIEVAKIMKKECPGCRVLLLTADPYTEEMLEKGRAEGNNFPVLMKPMDPGELLFAMAGPENTSWRRQHGN